LFQTSNVFIGLLGERYGYNPANTDTHHALVESLHAAAAEFPPVGAQMSARSCLAVGRCPPRLSSKHSAEDLAACQRPTALGAATLPVVSATDLEMRLALMSSTLRPASWFYLRDKYYATELPRAERVLCQSEGAEAYGSERTRAPRASARACTCVCSLRLPRPAPVGTDALCARPTQRTRAYARTPVRVRCSHRGSHAKLEELKEFVQASGRPVRV
jgi:hypothetical protein